MFQRIVDQKTKITVMGISKGDKISTFLLDAKVS